MAKKKLLPKERKASKSVRQLMAERKVIEKLQADVDRLAGELSDERRKARQMESCISSLETDLDKEKGRVKGLEHVRQRMLEEYYELGKCLSATRGRWQEAERKLAADHTTFNVEWRVARPQDGCDQGPTTEEPNGGP